MDLYSEELREIEAKLGYKSPNIDSEDDEYIVNSYNENQADPFKSYLKDREKQQSTRLKYNNFDHGKSKTDRG